MYKIPTTVVINDTEYGIRNNGDYRVILDCFSALQDVDLTEQERVFASLIIFYQDLNNLEDFQSPLSGKTIDVISKLFHQIMNKGIIVPSKTLFSKGPFIKCSYKANDGVLYFFEKTILFIHKPVLEIEHDSIKEVDIARIQSSMSSMQQRSFDITIKLKKESYQFSGIDIIESDILQKYMNDKKLNLKIKDEDNNNIEIMKYTSSRRRAPVSDELPNLPSEDEMADEDFSDSGEENDEYADDEDDEEDEEEEKEKKYKAVLHHI